MDGEVDIETGKEMKQEDTTTMHQQTARPSELPYFPFSVRDRVTTHHLKGRLTVQIFLASHCGRGSFFGGVC
jgi:hypothetical protein